MRKTFLTLLAVILIVSMLAACAPAATQAPAATGVPVVQTKLVESTKMVVATQIVQITNTPAPDRVQVTWYIGLGAGAQPANIPLEKAWVDKYNKSQTEIQLIPIIVDNKYARDNMTTQIAGGNAPDIVGPVGTAGRMAFPGAFLDLEPLVKQFNYNTSDIDPNFLQFYRDEGKLVGLPFAIYPEALYVNKDLFKEAGLALPPQKYGDKYSLDGKDVEWNYDTLTIVAQRLTVDKNGKDATEAGFDAKNIVQYGYVPQWTDNARALGTLFGAWEPFVDGKAVFPEAEAAGLKWYYDGMFGPKPFIPNAAAINSDLMKGNAWASGKVAIGSTHTWYTCCIDPKVIKNWDLAVMPTYNGKVTARMHGDTFAIMAASKHPAEAFKVYTYMLGAGSAELYPIYGGLPARKSQQQAFFDGLDKTFAPNKANWGVFLLDIPYMDVPNHEHIYAKNGSFSKLWDAYNAMTSKMQADPKLDFAKFLKDSADSLTAIYNGK